MSRKYEPSIPKPPKLKAIEKAKHKVDPTVKVIRREDERSYVDKNSHLEKLGIYGDNGDV